MYLTVWQDEIDSSFFIVFVLKSKFYQSIPRDDTSKIKSYLTIIPPTCFLYRGGLRGKKLINELGNTMLSSGGTFGTFLAIGSAIRC